MTLTFKKKKISLGNANKTGSVLIV